MEKLVVKSFLNLCRYTWAPEWILDDKVPMIQNIRSWWRELVFAVSSKQLCQFLLVLALRLIIDILPFEKMQDDPRSPRGSDRPPV